MRVLLHVALAASLSVLGCVAAAQEDRVETRAERAAAELTAGLNKLLENPEAVEQAVGRSWPMFDVEKRKAYAEHLAWILRQEDIRGHLIGLVKPAVEANFTREQLQVFFMQASTELQARGVRRLDDQGIAFYLGAMRHMMESIPPQLCKAALTGQLTTRENAYLEQKWLSGVDMPQFNAVLEFYKRAMVAEAMRSPTVRTLTSDQTQLVTKAVTNAFGRRADSAPEGRIALAGALMDMKAAEPQLVCRAASMAMESNLDLDEPLRSWALVKFAADVSR